MITGEIQLRPRYGEVDKMGFVFVDSRSMLPQKAPVFVINTLKEHSKAVYS